jgi:hypothetical protein
MGDGGGVAIVLFMGTGGTRGENLMKSFEDHMCVFLCRSWQLRYGIDAYSWVTSEIVRAKLTDRGFSRLIIFAGTDCAKRGK